MELGTGGIGDGFAFIFGKSDIFMTFVASLISPWIGDILYTYSGGLLAMDHVWDQSEIPLMVSIYDILNILSL